MKVILPSVTARAVVTHVPRDGGGRWRGSCLHPTPDHEGVMDGRQTGFAFGGLLAFVGLMLIGIGSAFLASANAAEARCRAANDGLDELSCMNFADMTYYTMLWWGIGLIGAGLLTALASWAWPRAPAASA